MVTTHRRPDLSIKTERQKSTDTTNDSYNYASRGFAHWLEVAPPSASISEVVKACHEHDSPHEAWPSGNRRRNEFGGANE